MLNARLKQPIANWAKRTEDLAEVVEIGLTGRVHRGGRNRVSRSPPCSERSAHTQVQGISTVGYTGVVGSRHHLWNQQNLCLNLSI